MGLEHFQGEFHDPSDSVTLLLDYKPKETLIRNRVISFLTFEKSWCEGRKCFKIPTLKFLARRIVMTALT